MGVFPVWAGDFWEILAKVADFWVFGDECHMHKSPENAGNSRKN
jgi:hypothetical protein